MIRRNEFISVLATLLPLSAAVNAQIANEEQLAANAALKYWQAFAMFPELDKQQNEIIFDWNKIPLNDDAVEVIEKGKYALTLLHRGAALQHCVWGLDIRGQDDVTEVGFAHLAKARQLARLALLRGRYRFEHGDKTGGVADSLAVLKLARHINSDGLLISWLVRASIEDHVHHPMAIDLLAMYLPTLDPETLRVLKVDLEELPPMRSTLKDMMLFDKETYWTSFRRRVAAMANCEDLPSALAELMQSLDPGLDVDAILAAHGGTSEGLLAAVDAAGEYWDQAAQLVSLPRKEAYAASAALKAKTKDAGLLVDALVPNTKALIHINARLEVRWQALLVAIDVLLDGPEAVNRTQDPCGDGPFTLHAPSSSGFELISALPEDSVENGKSRDSYVRLTVGPDQK